MRDEAANAALRTLGSDKDRLNGRARFPLRLRAAGVRGIPAKAGPAGAFDASWRRTVAAAPAAGLRLRREGLSQLSSGWLRADDPGSRAGLPFESASPNWHATDHNRQLPRLQRTVCGSSPSAAPCRPTDPALPHNHDRGPDSAPCRGVSDGVSCRAPSVRSRCDRRRLYIFGIERDSPETGYS